MRSQEAPLAAVGCGQAVCGGLCSRDVGHLLQTGAVVTRVCIPAGADMCSERRWGISLAVDFRAADGFSDERQNFLCT